MATSEAARLLDELMGRYRNNLPNDTDKRLSWESLEVCRYYLVKFCPHDLFTNTKSDLGACDKIHDEELRKEYEASTSHRKIAYEDDFMRYADSMLADVDRRIEKGRQRLALSVQEALANSSTGDGRIDEQIQFLSERITGLVSEAERLGSEGNVEEAQGLSKLCDKLREERDALRRANENSVWHQVSSFVIAAEMAASQEKQMEVCEICGAFLIVGDAQQRIDDHLTGKQHVGFAKLRQAIKEIRERREEREQQREKEREERRQALEEDERRKEREREDRRRRDDNYRRGYDRRERHRDERDYRDKDYRHSRDRDHRSRSDRDYHNHRHNRDRSSRDRDRDHHRSRDRGVRDYN